MVELNEVSVVRGGNRLLDRISLRIPEGRHTAILGPNGAGKTSLLRLLTRQYYPSVEMSGATGQVRLLGRDEWHVSELRQRMGVVSSTLDQHYSDGRTGRMLVEEAVASGITATELAEFGVKLTDDVLAKVDRSLEQVGATHLKGRRTETLSTGERRRVLIARALVHQPAVLLLDEPTTGLDVAARHRFVDWLQQLTELPKTTVILVTHHVEEVVSGFGHVVLLDRGAVVFDGPRCGGMTDARLSALFDVPLRLVQRADGGLQATVAADGTPGPV